MLVHGRIEYLIALGYIIASADFKVTCPRWIKSINLIYPH